MYMTSKLYDQWWKFWYWYVGRRDRQSEVTFMNYGFSNHQELNLSERDEFNRYPIQLYDYVTSYLDIKDLDVLEVGSGRGGGAEYITRAYKPRTYKGVDLNRRAVIYCNRTYANDGLSFTQADALKLPFEDNSFDVVLNIESSHRYPDVEKFFKEVRRVLKPRGHFLFTDFRDDYLIDQLHRQLVGSEMEIKKKECITENVLKALDMDHDRRRDLIDRLSPYIFRGIARAFSGTRGTSTYRWFENKEMEYLYYVMQKPRRGAYK